MATVSGQAWDLGLTELRAEVVADTLSRLNYVLKIIDNDLVISGDAFADASIFQGNGSISVGPVLNDETGKKEAVLQGVDYRRLRAEYIHLSTEARRDIVAKREDYEETLTGAVIQYEMLYVKPRKSMSLVLKNTADFDYAKCSSLKDAVSIVYNRARVFGILERYKAMTESGIYPDLPPLHEIKIIYLDGEEEQALIKDFIIKILPVLRDVSSAEKGRIDTHKLPSFLVLLSRKVSLYYSNVRITETVSRDSDIHLLHSRIVLLKCVLYVYDIFMAICGIKGLAEL